MSADDTRARVITEPLGGSALSQAVQSRRLPPELQPWWPSAPGEWREHFQRLRGSVDARWLENVTPAFSASDAAATRLERVRAENGVVITTGQQAGLFGGPLYTLAKALSALALADTLEAQLGVPVAPVFWAATDDADFLEASVAHLADSDGVHELKLERTAAAGTPMSAMPLAGMRSLIAQLRKSSGSAAYASYFDVAAEAFTAERTLGSAYVRLLRGILEPIGIAVLDSSHATVREAMRPLLLEALGRASDVARATSERATAIRRAGFEPQVEDDRGLSLVFVHEKGIKRRISVSEASRVLEGNSGGELSPNVLLRPVIERALMPTLSYVAGPGELAYFTQANAVADALRCQTVVGVPRWSCTVIEPFVERALRRLQVDYKQLKDLHALERRLATAALPPKVAAAWRALQEQVHDAVRNLGEAVSDSSLLPSTVIEGLDRSLNHRLTRTERRLLAAQKRRDERVKRDLDVASAGLFPMGQRQERVLNYVPMLARSGDPLLEEMRAAAAKHAAALVGSERPEPVIAR
jgi:bacillithiol synthase